MPWIRPKVSGTVPPGRGGHASCALGSKLYVFGGANRSPEAFKDLWCLQTDGGNYSWTKENPKAPEGVQLPARSGATLTAVGDRLYIFGGQDPETGICFNDVVVYEPDSQTWDRIAAKGGSPPPRHSHTACCCHTNRILVFGGSGQTGSPTNDVWMFDTELGEWSRPTVKGQAPAPREMHSAVYVEGHGLVIYGGRSDGSSAVLSDVVVLDIDKLEWAWRAQTKHPRCSHAGAGIGNKKVLFYGGFTGAAVEGDAVELNLATRSVRVASVGPDQAKGYHPGARFAHSAVEMTGSAQQQQVVVFGGVTPEMDISDIAVWTEPLGGLPASDFAPKGPAAVPASDLD
uniref:Uncharacterized protein n=1 Tax=Pyramimonas obovata TaxID=1411642 RepID=A0A7S0R239_9CHLO|mmetsp:Transcript_2390/g.4876  ORF Transcript_2390/g.4876 Transcript_2390/m.4876 type:complete len:344 (+) Transcript_2390:10-1041(+)